MAKRDKYRNKKASDFFDYTEGKLSGKERNAFERRMQKDPFDADAAEGFSRVSREEAEQDLHNAAGNIRRRIARADSRTKYNRRIAWYSAAAAIASLMIVTTVYFRLNDNGLERFETAPEMREAAREQSAPLQEAVVEQERPVGEEAMDQDEPARVATDKTKKQSSPLRDAIESEEQIEKVLMEQEKQGQKAAMTEAISEKGVPSEAEMMDEESFPVTAGQEAKKGYDLKEMQIHEKKQTLDQEENNLAKELPVAAEEDRQAVEEDHAFAWEKMEEEAAAGRYKATRQRMAAPEAPTEPMVMGEAPQQPMAVADALKEEIATMPDETSLDEIVVTGYGTSKKTNMTATVAEEEADPSGSVENANAVPKRGVAWDSYIADHEEWRETRLERLKSERGWLNLAGLFWLEEGENSFGSDPSNTIIFPKDFPLHGGSLILAEGAVTLNADPAAAIFAGGEQITRAELQSDQQANTTTLETGSYRWFIIRRGDRFGIRLRDLDHPRIGLLDSIPSYPFSKKWVVEAELVEFDSARTIEVPTVIDGFSEQYKAPGELTFEMNGKKHALLPFKSGDGYFLIFGDGTNGLETYGGGRFLYTDRIEGSKVIIDFNRAYNPPCVFSPFATCPLPPPGNLLDLKVEAGEKGVHLD